MNEALLGIGSNIDRDANIVKGLDELGSRFSALQLSSVYESEAAGFDGPPFYNLVACIKTDIPLKVLVSELRQIEYQMGRQPGQSGAGSRTLDIDILTYNDLVGNVEGVQLPRPDIVSSAYVLKPLAELVPHRLHPELRISYRQLWHDWQCDQYGDQSIRRVDFQWPESQSHQKQVTREQTARKK